ncbi:tail assembly chaperone [Lederbergia citri]|uniref:Phage tail assembly chaperone protein, TAC n=1 Tax=Lederbergia citri TaxID=2833580 RepID=A0A942TEG7_9BACI|nr:tail assembly chaperone [Lederbergia citri]MBS4195328.1 hypothetical protein [Lederbergia citri]
MATFEINGKEYELKITYAAVKRLNNVHEGGSFELIGKAIAGDFETFPHIVHAGLLHTGENFSFATIETAIEEAIENEKLSLDDVMRISNEVVTQSFFYKPTVDKLTKKNPEMKKALEELLN